MAELRLVVIKLPEVARNLLSIHLLRLYWRPRNESTKRLTRFSLKKLSLIRLSRLDLRTPTTKKLTRL